MLAPPDAADGDERRHERFADVEIALERLLEATRRREGLEAVVLGDPSGCLVAGAGVHAACEELAALAPLLAAAPTPANDAVPTRLDVLERRAAVRRLMLDGIEVFLCGRGAEGHDAALGTLAAGCRRILDGGC